MPPFKFTVPPGVFSKRIDAYLAENLRGEFSRQEVKAAILSGKILLNGKPAKPRVILKAGDRIEGEAAPNVRAPLQGEDIALEIIYEDGDVLVVDKPAGMVVHPGAGRKTGTLVHALVGRGSALSDAGGAFRPGIVHRLDKETSGLLLVAKNNAAHRDLQSQFAERSLSKTYAALVKGKLDYEEGRIDEPIGRDRRIRTKMAVSRAENAREAHTRYRVVRRFGNATLLEVKLITGRTHQIRVHLAHIGHPVCGDAVYGVKTGGGSRLALHASKIEFRHPKNDKMMTFESPIPEAMQTMIREAENEKR